MPLVRSTSAVRREQQVDHQPDDLARREVVAGGLVRGFIEPPDQVLEDQAHLVVRHRVGVQVDLGELADHQEQPVGFVQLGDLLLELEILEDLAGLGGERLDVVGQVLGDLVRVALQLLEIELAGVVERVAGDPVQDRLEVLDAAAFQRRVLLQHLRLGRLQHAVQPAQDGQRQDHPAVLRRLIRAAEQVRDRPDERNLLAEIGQTNPRPSSLIQTSRKHRYSAFRT